MKKFYSVFIVILLFGNTRIFSQCSEISLSDAYAKINKGFNDDYSLELSDKKVIAQKVAFFSCSPLNYNCINAFQFCLSNTSDVQYRSIKYKITIKTPDGKVLHSNIYTSNIALKPDATISVKQLLGTDIKSKWSFYQSSFPTTIEILKLEIDAKQTIRLMFDGIKDAERSTMTDGRKKGVIERYELAKKLDQNAYDSDVQKIYESCVATSTLPSHSKEVQDNKLTYTPNTLEEFNEFWKRFQNIIKNQNKTEFMENSIANILDISSGDTKSKSEYFSGYNIFSQGNLKGKVTIISYSLQDKFYGLNNCSHLSEPDQNITLSKFYPKAPSNMVFFAVRYYKKYKGSEGGFTEQGLLFTSMKGKFYFIGTWHCSVG